MWTTRKVHDQPPESKSSWKIPFNSSFNLGQAIGRGDEQSLICSNLGQRVSCWNESSLLLSHWTTLATQHATPPLDQCHSWTCFSARCCDVVLVGPRVCWDGSLVDLRLQAWRCARPSFGARWGKRIRSCLVKSCHGSGSHSICATVLLRPLKQHEQIWSGLICVISQDMSMWWLDWVLTWWIHDCICMSWWTLSWLETVWRVPKDQGDRTCPRHFLEEWTEIAISLALREDCFFQIAPKPRKLLVTSALLVVTRS